MEPTWQSDDGRVKLWLGDCLKVMKSWEDGAVDAVVTDPPYGDYEQYQWDVADLRQLPADLMAVRGFWFWKGRVFPLEWTARHVWSKANRNIGKNAEQYEDIYELNGSETGLVFRHAVIDSEMNARLNGDGYFDHPCQKPIRLMSRLIAKLKGTIRPVHGQRHHGSRRSSPRPPILGRGNRPRILRDC